MKVKVFISWSGETSRKIAENLSQWLPKVLQNIEPFFSHNDIDKGKHWDAIIAEKLAECQVGIICITPDNINSQWINFEAGALSKNLEQSKVCPVLFNLSPANIEGPFTSFQATKFEEGDMLKLLRTLNMCLAEDTLPDKSLEEAFDVWWPKLQEAVSILLKATPKDSQSRPRTEREILEEVLETVRQIQMVAKSTSDRPTRDIVDTLKNVVGHLRSIILLEDDLVSETIYRAIKPIYIHFDMLDFLNDSFALYGMKKQAEDRERIVLRRRRRFLPEQKSTDTPEE